MYKFQLGSEDSDNIWKIWKVLPNLVDKMQAVLCLALKYRRGEVEPCTWTQLSVSGMRILFKCPKVCLCYTARREKQPWFSSNKRKLYYFCPLYPFSSLYYYFFFLSNIF